MSRLRPWNPSTGARSRSGRWRVCSPLVLAIWLAACSPVAPTPTRPPPASVDLPDAIRARVEAEERREDAGDAQDGGPIEAAGRELAEGPRVRALYRSRGYAPLWVEGALDPRGAELLSTLADARRQGLDPADYRVWQLDALAARIDSASLEPRVDLELLLSDVFIRYASDRATGRVDPVRLVTRWHAAERPLDVPALAGALDRLGPGAALAGLDPPSPAFGELRDLLDELLAVADAGGWGRVSDGPSVHVGERHPSVAELRRRLALEPGLASSGSVSFASGSPAPVSAGPEPDPQLLDVVLARTLRTFQRRHGLQGDGVLGRRSRAAANVSAAARAEQVALNLERWRWLPQKVAPRSIRVNVAAAEVELIEDGSVPLRMRAIVGRPYRQTPVFSARLTRIVLNPVWHVPDSIASQDLRAREIEEPGFLRRQGFQVFEGWDAGAREVDPEDIDWAALDPEHFPYHLEQRPGPQNALGAIKFVLPNPYQVFLHDTPDRARFALARRAASSGCVRLQRAWDLADALMAGDPAWPAVRERARGEPDREIGVSLPEPVPVHFLYWTAWVDEEGNAQFRPDLYERDERLRRALDGTLKPEPEEEPAQKRAGRVDG